MPKGKIVMLPMPIGPLSVAEMGSVHFMNTVRITRFWVAENARTTRRFISSLKLGIDIPTLDIFELNDGFQITELHQFLKKNIAMGNIAVTSEAGLPGMADPGSEVARWAHKNDTKIETFSGPGSVYMALCASGFNGQQFSFHGYCPIKEDDLKKFLAEMVVNVTKTGYTQIFIETPYRSDKILAAMLRALPDTLHLCIACGLHTEDGFIQTKTIAGWRLQNIAIGKQPAVFLLGVFG
jgi:16S rRNA (cytidine1402-2'-O)-methyltransferase